MIFIRKIKNRHPVQENDSYPYCIPSLRSLGEMEFRKSVTFIIGENGSGKSTLIEAIAVNAGFNPEGGGRNFHFNTKETHSDLYRDLLLVRGPERNKDGYFMRAESFYNLATEIDEIAWGIHQYYGGESLHLQSHGESFLSLFANRLGGNGLYLFDEPEAALSLKSIFALMAQIKALADRSSQFVIATHSPILLAYPGAEIYQMTDEGPQIVEYEETEQYQLTKYFLNNHRRMTEELLHTEEPGQ